MSIQAPAKEITTDLNQAYSETPRFDCDSATVLGRLTAYGSCAVEGPRNSGKTLLLREIAQKAGLMDLSVISIDANTLPNLPEEDVSKTCDELRGLDETGVAIIDHFDNLLLQGQNGAVNRARKAVLEALDGKRVIIATDGRSEGSEIRNALFTDRQRHEFVPARKGIYL